MGHIASATLYPAKAAERRGIFAGDAVERDKQGERALAQPRLLKQHHLVSVNIPTLLDVTSGIFGSTRSAVATHGFDRFWRNVCAHAPHNPAEYGTYAVGQWFLTGAYPQPGTYR